MNIGIWAPLGPFGTLGPYLFSYLGPLWALLGPLALLDPLGLLGPLALYSFLIIRFLERPVSRSARPGGYGGGFAPPKPPLNLWGA